MVVDLNIEEAQLIANQLHAQKSAAERTSMIANSALQKIQDANKKEAEAKQLENVEGPA